MPTFGLGLRSKSMLALTLVCIVSLLPFGWMGWRLVEDVREHFGWAYARNYTLLNREKLLAPLGRELALSQRLAESESLRQWLLAPTDATKKQAAFAELERFRQAFREKTWFLAGLDQLYYYDDQQHRDFTQPRYRMYEESIQDNWYYLSMASNEPYNLNIDYNEHMGFAKVWINVQVRNGQEKIGVIGSGLELSDFLQMFIAQRDAGVTPMILTLQGAIQAHPDARMISLNSGAGQVEDQHLLTDLLVHPQDRLKLRATMQTARQKPGEVLRLWAELGGKQQLIALSYIPELKWFVVTAIDLHTANVLEQSWLRPALIGIALLLLTLILGFTYGVEKLVLQPLRRLQRITHSIADGHYELSLPPPRSDEIGKLSGAFAQMAGKLKQHTEQLEGLVQARTHALEQANADMAQAHKKIADSIDYASLLQRAILPDKLMAQTLGQDYFVLWQPRDVVGGDFYLFHRDPSGYLIGVVDCAGHGVPGALMTMLAHAAFAQAIHQHGLHSPATILSQVDSTLRHNLLATELRSTVASNMDVGLAYIDQSKGQLRFAGAKMALLYSQQGQIQEIKGGRRALVDKRQGQYQDSQLDIVPGQTFFLASDGLVDQAGGEAGFGFGHRRLHQQLLQSAQRSMNEQAQIYHDALLAYQGTYPQRDDLTLVGFRFSK